MSRTLEVGRLVSPGSLCLFSAPCPGCLSPGNTWEAYRSRTAPFTSRNRPTNSSSLTTLNSGAARGYTGVPPVERSVAISCVLIPSPPGRANHASSSRPVGTRLVSQAMLMWPVEMLPPPDATALLQVLQAKSTEGHARVWSRSGSSERAPRPLLTSRNER